MILIVGYKIFDTGIGEKILSRQFETQELNLFSFLFFFVVVFNLSDEMMNDVNQTTKNSNFVISSKLSEYLKKKTKQKMNF